MKTLQELFAERNRLFKERFTKKPIRKDLPMIVQLNNSHTYLDHSDIESFNQETQQLAVEWMLENVITTIRTSRVIGEKYGVGIRELNAREQAIEDVRSLLKQIIT